MRRGSARHRLRGRRSRSRAFRRARSSRSKPSHSCKRDSPFEGQSLLGRQNDLAMATLELPETLRPVLDAVVAVSEGYDGVYLVGGSVRDILLGEPNFDVDVVVEGDAIALANALAEQLEGRARSHRQFGTAVVVY